MHGHSGCRLIVALLIMLYDISQLSLLEFYVCLLDLPEPLAFILLMSIYLLLAGDGLAILRAELKSQRKHVRDLKKKSLWSKILEEVGYWNLDVFT